MHWDHEGGALLSVPTREYLQSSVWTDPALEKAGSKTPITPANPVSAPPHLQQHQNQLHHYASAISSSYPGNPSVNAELRPELRPETQLSLGSEDPRYREFSTISSDPHGDGIKHIRKPLPDWIQEHIANDNAGRHREDTPTDEGPMSPSSPTNHGHVIDHLDAQISAGIVGVSGSGAGASFDYGFTADAFANVTPDSSWDYRANRTAVIYDSGDDSETDADHGAAGNAAGGQAPVRLGLQTEMLRMGTGPSGVIISEGVALSPSDVDSDVDVTVAAGASRFVMQERIRRVYGPLEGDSVESDALDNSSLEQSEEGNDSDVTEDGRNQRPDGPTRIGKLKKERMRLKEEEELERLRREEEERQQRALAILEAEREGDMDDRKSLRSMRSARSDMRLPLPKRLPPVPIGVIEAWQAGLLYALTRCGFPA